MSFFTVFFGSCWFVSLAVALLAILGPDVDDQAERDLLLIAFILAFVAGLVFLLIGELP